MTNFPLLSATSTAPRITKKVKIVLFFIVFTAVMYFYYAKRNLNPNTDKVTHFIPSSSIESAEVLESRHNNYYGQPESNSTKYILFWRRFFNNSDWVTGDTDEAGEEILKSVQCPVTNCFFTHNHTILKDIKEFDAIVFHAPEHTTKIQAMPKTRSAHQLYFMASLE